MVWNKFDFVPGTEIIFEDNQEGEQNGEFPGKWDLSGGVAENAFFDGTNVIMFRKNNINGSDGDAPANQKLSEARAKAVREMLIKAGIQADRLTSKGHGESKPVSENNSPEGKAQNRRVEFIKTNS